MNIYLLESKISIKALGVYYTRKIIALKVQENHINLSQSMYYKKHSLAAS